MVAFRRMRGDDSRGKHKSTCLSFGTRRLADSECAEKMTEAQDAIVFSRSRSLVPTVLDPPPMTGSSPCTNSPSLRSKDDYFRQRDEIERRERALGFEHACTAKAGPKETRANGLLQHLKRQDEREIYEAAEATRGHDGQRHARWPGDHFLSNVELIESTAVFRVARRMPKGAHLHIHFNACLPPDVLLDVAKGMDRMFITSDLPLTAHADHANFQLCEIQFSLLPPEKESPGDLFAEDYVARQTMPLREFLVKFPSRYPHSSADEWLRKKLQFCEDEAHNKLQTSHGAWEKFNGRTRMMKGLFNYEKAYRIYTRLCLEDFVRDNIQYAEIRPNFMETNQLFTDDASGSIGNAGIMSIIIDEYEKFQASSKQYFAGLKVIYCTPRSFSNEKVKFALTECLEFKKRWPKWIAGFDLVGEEARGHPLKQFIPEFLDFREQCSSAGLDIPFLFHCGETLEDGTDTDGNLLDALLLGARRIGHGFALVRHPYVMEHMKKRGVCLELCPISNEVLGLTPRVGGHAMYGLLANNVHCTVNSDNGTFFRSTLSHDFYQVMVGKSNMTLHGWRQLIEWSLEHSCMDEDERQSAQREWEALWDRFLDWMIDTYGKGGSDAELTR